jgi:hypothetical protein
LKALRIARFTFHLEAIEAILLPPYKGSALLYDGESKRLKMAHSFLAWEDLLHNTIPPEYVKLSFRTPTRIRYSGCYILELEFHILIRNPLRTIATVSAPP